MHQQHQTTFARAAQLRERKQTIARRRDVRRTQSGDFCRHLRASKSSQRHQSQLGRITAAVFGRAAAVRPVRFEAKVTQNPLNPQSAQPQVLLCSSDATHGRLFELTDAESGRKAYFGKANYAAFSNPFHIDSWFFSGAIWLYGRRLDQLVDGTSTTLVFAEIRTRDHSADQRRAWALPWSGSTLLSLDFHPRSYPSGTTDQEKPPGGYEPNS